MVGQIWDSYTFTPPEWCAEMLTNANLLSAGTQADITQFEYSDAQTLTLSGTATAGTGVSLTLSEALGTDILRGVILDFGSGKTFTLTQRAKRGATTLTGDLAADTADSDTYDYPGSSGRTVVRSGALVGRTFVERAAGSGFGPADVANDDEIYLVAFQNEYLEQDVGITLVRHNAQVYEDKLPGWAAMTADEQAKIRELYHCITYPS
ncbi:MAG: hypothetical protein AAFY20_21845 [Cyanobacteria bacterium J06639_14]